MINTRRYANSVINKVWNTLGMTNRTALRNDISRQMKAVLATQAEEFRVELQVAADKAKRTAEVAEEAMEGVRKNTPQAKMTIGALRGTVVRIRGSQDAYQKAAHFVVGKGDLE